MAWQNPTSGTYFTLPYVERECPEFGCYRDIAFFSFWFQQPTAVLSQVQGTQAPNARPCASLAWGLTGDNAFIVTYMNQNLTTAAPPAHRSLSGATANRCASRCRV